MTETMYSSEIYNCVQGSFVQPERSHFLAFVSPEPAHLYGETQVVDEMHSLDHPPMRFDPENRPACEGRTGLCDILIMRHSQTIRMPFLAVEGNSIVGNLLLPPSAAGFRGFPVGTSGEASP